MFANQQNKSEKKPEKLFSECAKPYSASNLPFYIIDILLGNYMQAPLCPAPLTTTEIQQEIQRRIGQFYNRQNIYRYINNLHLYSHTIAVHYTTKKVPRNVAKAFYISFKKINTSNAKS